MGSVAKVVKKVTKVAKKPFSKITKGIARGIAKVGKSVMKGVGRLSKKLGPLGMIALSVAMPYALSGLSTAIGHGGMAAGQASGWLGSQNVFLRSIGQVGNAIRTGYQASTGAIGKTWSTITKSIGNGFQKFQTGGGNIWTRISNGTKNLFNSARNQVAKLKKFTPKFRQGQLGQVELKGVMGRHGPISSTEAANLIQRGTLQGSDIYSQTLGSPEGWFTKGSSQADSLVTQTINDAIQPRLNMLDADGLRMYTDHVGHQFDTMGSYRPDEALDTVMNSKGTTRTFAHDFDKVPSGYKTNLGQTGDYKLYNPNEPTSYTFTGDKTYNNNVGKSSIKKASNIKKGMKYAAGNLAKGLLTQTPGSFKHPDIMYASAADMTHQTTAGYGGTDIQGSWGGSLLQGAFDDNQRERIMNYYKNMNIIGSQ